MTPRHVLLAAVAAVLVKRLFESADGFSLKLSCGNCGHDLHEPLGSFESDGGLAGVEDERLEDAADSLRDLKQSVDYLRGYFDGTFGRPFSQFVDGDDEASKAERYIHGRHATEAGGVA